MSVYPNFIELLQIQYCTIQDLYHRTISAVCSFIVVLVFMNKTLSGHLQELKNKGKVQLGNSKSGHGRLLERFIIIFKLHFKRGFTALGGRNLSWLLTRVVARRALTLLDIY